MTTPREMLRDIADAALLLTTTMPGAEGGASSGATLKPPMHLHVLDLVTEAHGILIGWVRVCVEDGLARPEWPTEGCDEPPPADDTPSVCWWLSRRVDRLQCHEAADDFFDELLYLHRKVMPLVGERLAVTPPCPQCGTRMAGMAADGAPSDQPEEWRWCRCPGCEAEHTFDAGLKRLAQLQKLTLPQWAEETGKPLRTVQWQVKRLQLRPVGSVKGRRVYSREDLVRSLLAA